MKNKFLIIFITFFLATFLRAEDLFIEAKDITLNKDKKTTIFKNSVSVKTKDKIISSEFAEFDKKAQTIVLKEDIIVEDKFKNTIKANYAEYNNIKKIFKSNGPTTLITSENYILEGVDIIFDNFNKDIKSNKPSTLKDLDGNEIYLENFEYLAEENIFKSIGLIKIKDKFNNIYEFSQIYIDTKKKEVLGTDIKAFLNSDDFKINKENDPRIFANTIKLSDEESTFDKSIFTICGQKENEKCPPWTLQASKMTHKKKNKTIYYNNAVIKIYDFPIFYLPYLSHPDPTVSRRSGFLPPSFSDSKNLGANLSIPYFWAISEDKNFTISNNLFYDQHPLFIGEYNQAFKDSNFLTDFGFTEGYKKTTASKKAGDKSHLFTEFSKNFKGKFNSDNSFNFITQYVSNNKYLKLYKIKSNLVDYNKDTLENEINFNHTKDDLFFGFKASLYETLNDSYDDKYEYIFPEVTIDKNIFTDDKFGGLDLQTNLKVHNYDTNKLTSFLVNNLNWESNDIIINSSIKNKLLGKLKNINYEAKNIDIFKEETTNELYGALGLLSEINFQKENNNSIHALTPKLLLRFSPGSMRKEENGSRLTVTNAFNLERLENNTNFETGNTATVGFDYSIKNNDIEKFNFSVAQIINDKENKKLHDKSSLNEKLSDLVGESNFKLNENIKFGYQFALDQNYQEVNYSDFSSKIELENLNIDFNYIEENKHIGNQEYFKSKVTYNNSNKSLISFETKRNLITDSAEFYDLSYEYINDCLRAGLVYRREFYNDSELKADNSLMFNITLIPFGNINSPKINK
jgi:LPS-assembly protein